jgi:hypothetical protein
LKITPGTHVSRKVPVGTPERPATSSLAPAYVTTFNPYRRELSNRGGAWRLNVNKVDETGARALPPFMGAERRPTRDDFVLNR